MNPEEISTINERKVLDQIAAEVEDLKEIFSRDDESIFQIYSNFENLKQLLAVIHHLGGIMRSNPKRITELDSIPEHIGKLSQAYEAIENMHMLITSNDPSTIRNNPEILRNFLDNIKPLILNIIEYSKIPNQIRSETADVINYDFKNKRRIN